MKLLEVTTKTSLGSALSAFFRGQTCVRWILLSVVFISGCVFEGDQCRLSRPPLETMGLHFGMQPKEVDEYLRSKIKPLSEDGPYDGAVSIQLSEEDWKRLPQYSGIDGLELYWVAGVLGKVDFSYDNSTLALSHSEFISRVASGFGITGENSKGASRIACDGIQFEFGSRSSFGRYVVVEDPSILVLAKEQRLQEERKKVDDDRQRANSILPNNN